MPAYRLEADHHEVPSGVPGLASKLRHSCLGLLSECDLTQAIQGRLILSNTTPVNVMNVAASRANLSRSMRNKISHLLHWPTQSG